MDNQVVKLELPSGGSEMHVGVMNKTFDTIILQPGTYKSGDVIASSDFLLVIPSVTLNKLGFKSFELLHTYMLIGAIDEISSKLIPQLYQLQVGSYGNGTGVKGKFKIMCTEDITTDDIQGIVPKIHSRVLLSNLSTTAGNLHILIPS